MQPQITAEDIKITPRDLEMPLRGGASITQVANYLSISHNGVRRLLETDPSFPKPKKLLRSVRWNAEAVIAWFERQEEVEHS